MTNDGWGKPAAPWPTTPAPQATEPTQAPNTWGAPVVDPQGAGAGWGSATARPAWGEPVTLPPMIERELTDAIEAAGFGVAFDTARGDKLPEPPADWDTKPLGPWDGGYTTETVEEMHAAIGWDASKGAFDNWGKPNVKPPATDYDYTPRDTKDDDTYPRFFEELATNEHGQRTRVAAYKFETEEHYNMALEAIEGEIREIPADEYVAHESYMKREDEWREGNFMGATLRSNAINAINRTETEFAVTEDGELEDVKDVIASGHKGEAVGFYIAYHNGKWLHAILSGPYSTKGDAYGIADTCYNKFINDEVFKRAFEGKFERSGVYCAELPLSAKRKGAYGVITNE